MYCKLKSFIKSNRHPIERRWLVSRSGCPVTYSQGISTGRERLYLLRTCWCTNILMPGTEEPRLNYLPENNFVCLFSALRSPLVFVSKCALPQDRIISSGAAPAVSVDIRGRGGFWKSWPQSPGTHTAWPPLLTALTGSLCWALPWLFMMAELSMCEKLMELGVLHSSLNPKERSRCQQERKPLLTLSEWMHLKRKVSREAEKVLDKMGAQCGNWTACGVGREGWGERQGPSSSDCRQHMGSVKGYSETMCRTLNMVLVPRKHFINERLVIATIVL